MKCVKLNHDTSMRTFNQIAQLHIDNIHHGVIPRLGRRFVASLYRELTKCPQTGVWVAIEGDQILGFICGCMNLKKVYRSLLTSPLFLFSMISSKLLVTPSILRLAFSALIYPFRRKQNSDLPLKSCSAELLAISVSANAQGKGIGRILVKAMENEFLIWGLKDKYQVTTNFAEIGSNAFYSAIGFQPSGKVNHHDLTLQIYQKNIT